MTNNLKFCDFKNLKGRHKGEVAFFFGSGPTIKKFDIANAEGSILVGVNETIFAGFQLDYLFVGDGADWKFRNRIKDFHAYEPRIAKYIGIDPRKNLDITKRIPGSVQGAIHYNTKLRGDFSANLEKDPVGRWGSISFDVMQILAFMGFQKIYLIGHDCDYKSGTFYTKFNGGNNDKSKLLSHWNKMKNFLDEQYTELEVVIVNPVALNIFLDATHEFEVKSDEICSNDSCENGKQESS